MPPDSLRCRPLRLEEYGLWDTLVDTAREGTLFHSSAWLGASGRAFSVIGVFSGSGLIGGVPVVVRRIGWLALAGHPPLTPYLGPVIRVTEMKPVTELSYRKRAYSALARYLRSMFHRITFRLPPEVIDLQPFMWSGFVAGVGYTYRVKLDGLDSVWQSMDVSRRNDIRRAQQDGLRVCSDASVDEVIDVAEASFRRQGLRGTFRHAARQYDQVLRRLGRCRGFIIKDATGNPLAAAYIVWDKKRAYYVLGGYAEKYRHHGAGPLALWESMRFAREEASLGEFDFEGSMVPPIESYFRKFGGILTPYYTLTWSARGIRPLVPLAEMVRGVFRTLGIPMARGFQVSHATDRRFE